MQWVALLALTSLTVLFETLARHVAHAGSGKVNHIRGIPLSKSSLYSPDRDFECLDGSLVLPFAKVNDDYCDCADGSDEPGTAACANGSFYCQNTGFQPVYIPSSWVNDGVCDCCDASDEYSSNIQCVDNCEELGREAWLQAQKAAELVKAGNKRRLEFIRQGKIIKTENQAKIEKLKTDLEEAEHIQKEREAIKISAEERESAALEKYKPPPEAEQSEDDEETKESEKRDAENYFKYLDTDNSGTVTIVEIQVRVTFDKDRNGEVSREEALYFLNNQEDITLQEFLDSAWVNVKPFVMRDRGYFKQVEKDNTETEVDDDQELRKDEEQQQDEKLEDEHHEDEEEHEDEDQNHEHEDEETPEETEDANAEEQPAEAEKPPAVEYDEETQAIIDEAKDAREKYREVERNVHTLQDEINNLQTKLERDYGPDQEFAVLDGQCYEYSDYEYVYTLCPFDKVTQKPRSGGSEVGLGQWNSWIGEGANKYTKAKFDRGLTCWNGPPRTTIVTLKCGNEDLLSVSEPNRCEYAMEFATSALCNPNVENADVHDEL